MDRMEMPCAVFYAAWERRAAPALTLPAASDDRRARIAAAIHEAARETTEYLRHEMDWSLVHSRLLAARFAHATEAWLREGEPDAIRLRGRLVALWRGADRIRAVEEVRRHATDAFLAGAAVGGAGSSAGAVAVHTDADAELYGW